ncbi:MAG: hypothetical protein WCY93_01595 [Anaerolineaceae bacterium]
MTYNSFQTISQILVRFENEVRDNPAPNKNDPLYIDFIVESFFEHPDWYPSDYVRFHEDKNGEPIRLSVRDFLRRNSIDRSDGKREVIQLTTKASTLLDNILSEDDAIASQAFAELIHMQGYYRRRWPFVARALMTQLANKLYEQKDAQAKELAIRMQSLQSQMLVPMSKRFINTLIEQTSMARGLGTAKSVTDKISSLLEDVNDAAKQEWGEAKDLESLQADNADLRAALHNLRYELEDLQTQLQNTQDANKADGIVTFLTELNSATSGNLLDNMAISQKVITSLIKNNWQPELPEIEGIVYSVKAIVTFLYRLGLEPLKVVGAMEKVTLQDLTFVNYLGSEFDYPDQVKWVKFQSPGWRYKGEIISWAKAIECDPETFMSDMEVNQ